MSDYSSDPENLAGRVPRGEHWAYVGIDLQPAPSSRWKRFVAFLRELFKPGHLERWSRWLGFNRGKAREPALELGLVQVASALGCPRSSDREFWGWQAWFGRQRKGPLRRDNVLSVSGPDDIRLRLGQVDRLEPRQGGSRFGPKVTGGGS